MESNMEQAAAALTLCQYIGDASYLTDAGSRILNANENCRYILGMGPEALIGKTVDDLWNLGVFDSQIFRFGYDTTAVLDLLNNLNEYTDLRRCNVKDAPRITPHAISQKTVVTGITKLAKNEKYVLYICIPLLDGGGAVEVAVVIVRDLTNIMRLNSKISKLTADLEYMRRQQTNEKFIGSSKAIMQVKYLIAQSAASDATILVSGETGTGKEIVAREIVSRSRRANKPYIRINCSAIPEGLFESEFFGYEKGAFTGALNTRKTGLLEMADGGTVLLDEVEDLPLNMQAKLLRAIQEREITRLGSTESVRIDVRLIASTNKDLKKMVEEGTFRRDFYYRINVVPIEIPPLRERQEDIVKLTGTFLNRFNEKYRKDKYLAAEALRFLEACRWPGNVRELEHTIERLVVIGEGEEITVEDVQFAVEGSRGASAEGGRRLQDMLDDYERRILESAVKTYGSSRKMAAALGISQPTVLRKLHRLHIPLHPETFGQPS